MVLNNLGSSSGDVNLTPEGERFIDAELRSGRFSSTSDLVNGALMLLKDQLMLMPQDAARIEEFRNKIAIGLAQLDRGEGAPLDIESIKARGRQRLSGEHDQNAS